MTLLTFLLGLIVSYIEFPLWIMQNKIIFYKIGFKVL